MEMSHQLQGSAALLPGNKVFIKQDTKWVPGQILAAAREIFLFMTGTEPWPSISVPSNNTMRSNYYFCYNSIMSKMNVQWIVMYVSTASYNLTGLA
jgi:hypothetical protein